MSECVALQVILKDFESCKNIRLQLHVCVCVFYGPSGVSRPVARLSQQERPKATRGATFFKYNIRCM